jgi:2-polyprenyl-3-methyl-5-hydroxy-6-metoxy-1,4-benzoquinol methylase
VGIANFGHGNAQHLQRVIREYHDMPWHVDIVVFSNIPKDLGPRVEVIVGLPSKDPWSLPFAHQPVFAARADQYDLFIYSEDDTLITRRNIEAFLSMTAELEPNEIAGFLRTEQSEQFDLWFPDVHGYFRWHPESVRTRGPFTCAFFSNEHAACYMLTRQQLHRAIKSGGYLVPPHEGLYDMLVSAATDVYTQCGFEKLVSVSHLEDFCVPHLSNKYVGKMGLDGKCFKQQIAALTGPEFRARTVRWVTTETRMERGHWSKDLYAPANSEAIAAVPEDAKEILSIGCDLGLTERTLVQRGARVTGIPVDSLTATCAAASGIEIVDAELNDALASLDGRRFDAILCLDVLHLAADPYHVVRSARPHLSKRGVFVATFPNTGTAATRLRKLIGRPGYRDMGDYSKVGVQWVTENRMRKIFEKCDLQVIRSGRKHSSKCRYSNRLVRRLGEPFFAHEVLLCGVATPPRNDQASCGAS